MSEFNFEEEIELRYRDLDPMGHVNNAVYVTYLEHARTNYIEAVLDQPPSDVGVVVANLEINYKRSIQSDESVTVGVRTTDIGTSSVPMEYEVRADGALAATANSVVVAVDGSGKPRPISDATREQIANFEGLSI